MLGIEGALAQTDRIRECAARFGVAVKPSSRLAVYEDYLQRFQRRGRTFLDAPGFNPAVFAHGSRDTADVSFICHTLERDDGAALAKALPDLLKGAPLPSEDRHHKPRNTQFEYFLAAYLKHSGYAVSLDEPDVLFLHEGLPLGIAAKRCVSREQVVRRVREAVRQLKRVGVHGFVALSLDRLAPWPHDFLVAGGETALDNAGQTLLQTISQQFAANVHAAIVGSSISGVLFSFTAIGCVQVPWQPAHVTTTLWLPRDDEATNERELVQHIVARLRAPSNGGMVSGDA